MKGRFGGPAAALALAGCATNGSGPEGHWLAGTWLMMDTDIEFPLACASGLPIQYLSQGRYHLFEEEGRWTLLGDRLTETASRLNSAADPGSPEVGRPYVSRIARQGPDAFVKTFADGGQQRFRRCPAL